jgi:enoyl-CoA hydratase/carnithine racemase
MALSCDLIIADERAEFALPEPQLGLVALAGGVQRLAMTIGVQRAIGMALMGRRVSAQEAFSLRFFTAMAAPGRSLAVANDWALMIAECSPAAIIATRPLARQAEAEALASAAARMLHPALARLRKSPDYLGGPRAFSERRKSIWSTKDQEARSP